MSMTWDTLRNSTSTTKKYIGSIYNQKSIHYHSIHAQFHVVYHCLAMRVITIKIFKIPLEEAKHGEREVNKEKRVVSAIPH